MLGRLGIVIVAGIIAAAPGLGVAAQCIQPGCAEQSEEVYLISTADALAAALSTATGGETLLLEEGEYGALMLDAKDLGEGAYTAMITLRSQNTDKPAVFSQMLLHQISNIRLEGLKFRYTYTPGDNITQYRPFQIRGGQNISISGAVFLGDVATQGKPYDIGFGAAHGLSARGTKTLTVEDSEFAVWYKAAGFHDIDNLVVRGNDIHSIRSDGLNFTAVQGGLVEANQIRDFKISVDSPDHEDMIQIWTTGTSRPLTDFVIRSNVLNSGTGLWTQSIFLRNELVDQGKAGRELWYQNLTIENNVIINAHLHGITVGETDGLFIRNNTVVRSLASKSPSNNKELNIPRINITPAAENVEIIGNVVSAIKGFRGQPSWSVGSNLMIQDVSVIRPGSYQKLFVSPPGNNPAKLSDFTYKPGGPLDGTGIGSDLLVQ